MIEILQSIKQSAVLCLCVCVLGLDWMVVLVAGIYSVVLVASSKNFLVMRDTESEVFFYYYYFFGVGGFVG